MSEKEIFKGITERITEKNVYEFDIEIDNPIQPKRTFIDWILRKPIQPVEKVRHFVIRPCKVDNMFRVINAALDLPDELFEGDLVESVMPIMLENKDKIVYCIASAIQNNLEEPSPKLIAFIGANFDNIDLFNGFHAAINGLEMQSFLNSIVLARGTISILKSKTNPMDGRE